MEDGFYRRVKISLAERGVSMQQALDTALMNWLGETKGTSRQTPANARDIIPTNEPEIHEKLDYILEHSEPDVAHFIRGNIEVFERDTRREQAHAAAGYHPPAAGDSSGDRRSDPNARNSKNTRGATRKTAARASNATPIRGKH